MANLDTLRGYAQNHYAEVHQYATTEYVPENKALGYQVLNEPMWNKGESVWFPLLSSSPVSPSRDPVNKVTEHTGEGSLAVSTSLCSTTSTTPTHRLLLWA